MKMKSWEICCGWQLLALVVMLAAATTAVGDIRTWIGAGEDAQASTAANWEDNNPPETGDSVLFTDAHLGNAQTNVTWNLDVDILNWTQTADYVGTVTIRTEYPDISGGTGFTNLVITGDVTLEGGVWTHQANRGDHDAWDRLSVTIGGDFSLTAPATINLTGRGFATERGLGAGTGTGQGVRRTMSGRGASHGGQGGWGSNLSGPATTYGSIVQPEMLGSGANSRGGGAVRLMVEGTATLNGLIQADGVPRADDSSAGAAGGSIYLRAAMLDGAGINGMLSARGASGFQAGGGGRIAVHLAASDDFNAIQVQAAGNTGPTTHSVWIPQGISGSGTIYLEGENNGERVAWLLIDNANVDTWYEGGVTPIPSELSVGMIEPHLASMYGKLRHADLFVSASARMLMLDDARMNDLGTLSANSKLELNGFSLFFRASEPPDFPALSEPSHDPVSVPAALGGGTILPEGGRVLWDNPTYELALLIWHGPNGTVDNFDSDEFYEAGSERTVTAVPNNGYAFVRWIGTVPEEEDAFTPELTVPVLPGTHLRAVFASTAANTYTWIGGNAGDGKADTAANWYPVGVPANGDQIVLDGASFEQLVWDESIIDLNERWAAWSLHSSDLDWNLNQLLASWTQTEDFTGWVTIWTEYPNISGGTDFTNLVVNGDVTLNGGFWTQRVNRGNHEQWDRLSVNVHGNFTLGPQGGIDVRARGFAAQRGPGQGDSAERTGGRAASHGGQGAYNSNVHATPSLTYGSILRPEALGSGCDGRGGGAVKIIAEGSATIDGLINADGAHGVTYFPNPRRSASSGGSVLVQAAEISGSGLISASGGSGYYSGGGGRVALVATQSPVMGGLITTQAYPGAQDIPQQPSENQQRRGTAGTVYLETTANAQVIVDAGGLTPQYAFPTPPPILYTPLMPDIRPAQPLPWGSDGDLVGAKLIMRDEAVVGLTSDLRMRDLAMEDETTRLRLQGYDLFLGVMFHSNWGEKDWVVYDGGRIRWLTGTLIRFR